MNRLIQLTLCAAFVSVPAASPLAQTCLGTASFASGPARVGVGMDFTQGANQYGAQLAFGKPAGPFAAAGIARADIEDTDESATIFQIDLGYSLGVSGQGTLEICPVVGFGYGTAGIDEGGISLDVSSRLLSAGFAIGGVVSSSPTFKLVPSVTVAYANQNVKSEGFIEFDESEDFGIITLAAGFVFNERVTLRPNFAFPVGLDESDPTYGIGISLNFGSQTGAR